MKIALIGRGRTGGLVWENLAREERHAAFDRSRPATVAALAGADAVIVFTPGEAVAQLIPILMETTAVVFWGSTGHRWSPDLDERLRARDRCWIAAANFSPGMVLVRALLSRLGDLERLLEAPRVALEEIHHAGKRDAPSGTALRWRDWLGNADLPIRSIREGDVTGSHRLAIASADETIRIEHEAHHRALFARGAVRAARLFTFTHNPGPGLHRFEDLAERLWEGTP